MSGLFVGRLNGFTGDKGKKEQSDMDGSTIEFRDVIGEIKPDRSAAAISAIAIRTQDPFTNRFSCVRVINMLIFIDEPMRNKLALLKAVFAGEGICVMIKFTCESIEGIYIFKKQLHGVDCTRQSRYGEFV